MKNIRRTISERISDEYKRKKSIVEGVEYDPEHSEKMQNIPLTD